MLRLVEQKKPTTSSPSFYAKVDGHRVPAVWRRTEVSTIHATVDGRVALCGDQTMLLPHSVHDGALDLSKHSAACQDCAALVFRVRHG